MMFNFLYRKRPLWTAIFPFIFAAISFALTLTIALAGQQAHSSLATEFLLDLDMSQVGQNLNIIVVNPSNSTSSGDSGDSGSSLLSGLASALQPFESGASTSINDVINQINDALAQTIVQKLDLWPYYNLYLRNICWGNSSAKMEQCGTYNDFPLFNDLENFPSSVDVAGFNISSPLLSQSLGSVSSIKGQSIGLLNAVFVFTVVSIVGDGVTALGSLLAVWRSPPVLVYLNLAFISLAASLQSMLALLLTAGTASIEKEIGSFGKILNFTTSSGTKTTVVAWIEFLFASLAMMYWLWVWFVEVRTFEFKMQRRVKEQ